MSYIGICYEIRPKLGFQEEDYDVYYGSTFDIESRWKKHCSPYETSRSRLLFEKYGTENLEINELSYHRVNSHLELEQIYEKKYIENNPCLNCKIPGKTQKEWFLENINKIKLYKKEYYIKNKEKIILNSSIYRLVNRTKYNEYHKNYRKNKK